MKKILVLLFLVLPALSHAQSDTSQKKTEQPLLTGFGLADGKMMGKEIGPGGGEIISDDGRVKLIFPAGALTSNTSISIQPTTNTVPSGTGKAYRFEPSGIQFKKPVQLIFHYSDDEAETCPADLMGLALQDQSGKWDYFDYEKLDSDAKTLTGYIQHFSYFTNVKEIALIPDEDTIAVNGDVPISVIDLHVPSSSRAHFAGAILRNEPIGWYVNQMPNGDQRVGTISTISTPWPLSGKLIGGTYSAPGVLPKENPVTIKLAFQYRKNGKKIWGSCKCQIVIYDAYRIKITQQFTTPMGSQLLDSATFSVWVYTDNIKIRDIKNYAPIVLKEGSMAGLREKLYTENALGTIHITESIKNATVSYTGVVGVDIEFNTFEITVAKFQYSSAGMRSEPQAITSMSAPENISFLADGTAHDDDVTWALGKYHLTVTPIRHN
jgi:hypothetical protein